MKTKALHTDCMDYMGGLPDNAFELSICDPPYGGGQHFNFRYGTGDQVYRNDKPDQEYFDQVLRISENAIIWGGNYFTDMLYPSRCWISWYKGNPLKTFSDFELAWTSFDKVSRAVKIESWGAKHADKGTIHPTQKPVALYRWLLTNYAKPGDRILDTHLGSGSSRIAAEELGFEFVGCELDQEYFEAQEKRFNQWYSQGNLFREENPKPTYKQSSIFD